MIFLYVTAASLTKLIFYIKDTQRERALSNNTKTLTESANMGVWVVGTSNHLFVRGP